VVDPTTVVKVEESLVPVEKISEVVIAEDAPVTFVAVAPDPPPTTVKIVVEPTTVVKVEESLVSVETMSEVVMAEEVASPVYFTLAKTNFLES